MNTTEGASATAVGGSALSEGLGATLPLVGRLRTRRSFMSTDGCRWYMTSTPDGDCQDAAAEIERLEALTYCGCGDQFTEHDPASCGTCCAVRAISAEAEIERLRAAMNEALPFTVTLGQQILTDALGPNVEFSGVPAGHSSNHPAGGTAAGTQG